ncbi:Interferon-induced GTP-binding protein Mx2 [Psilocybe cubensis]|uniref:Uncharacterized protein n=2 Tax=Psilocybe cubensis TaxID=181762 RepID=A0A8H7Y8Q1_PSICU|nr:Interferon-induced GTP-binding protein Mx2 [Psilocybe cubensis]KAH9485773.1 Interferon-induced GTP-binding protein Mx2 [Psilocybe cubensis]
MSDSLSTSSMSISTDRGSSSPPHISSPNDLSSVDTVLPSHSNGVGLANPQLSGGRRKMLDLVNKLHSTGVQVDIDLPQIAVIGSQSAGKSSLIESISGITLPRAAGTCTRCPTECRLSRSDSAWKCVVSLRFTTDANGQPLGQARNEPFGAIIYDKSEVEDRIRRAQRAILNPTKPAKFFLDDDQEEELLDSQLSFSLNAVTLQISGPDVADLSFCDLPGLIASVSSSSRGSGNDIALVESLVTTYIKKPSCIILLTVACETDFENQGAHRLAKHYDPDGKRTIGVLTKPDRIPLGEESNWLPFIRNEKETLENNWFCVKQPSSNDLKRNITWSEARQMENDFFSSKAPWCELEGLYQKYLRTSNLVERLSNVLSDLISKRLPQIQDELEKSIILTRGLLSKLPPAPSSNPRSEILALLHKFTSDFLRHVEGVSDDPSTSGTGIGLMQAIHPAQERFRREIRRTSPNFRPFKRIDAATKHLPAPAFLRNEEGNTSDDSGSGDSSNEVSWASLCKRKTPADDIIYVDDVLDRAQRARTRELPGHYPFVVQRMFIDSIVKEWQAPAQILCKIVHNIVSDNIKDLIKEHFGEFGQGHLEQRVRTIVQQHLKQCLERTEERIIWLIKLEELPFSLNTHYLADYRAKFLAHYKSAREKYEQPDVIDSITRYKVNPVPVSSSSRHATEPTGIAKALAGLAEAGLSGVAAHDLAKLLPPDPMEPALNIMADVRAYFQVAYKRFTDNVPLAIDLDLVRGAERNILSVLYSNLGINGVDGHRICMEMAQESPQVADRRADLQKKLERLEVASGELLSLGV